MDWTGSILRFVETHFSEKICAKGIAECFGISKGYVCCIVKTSTGLTVVEFLHRMQIEEAKRLLRENKNCIYLIAGYVGFKCPCHFSRVFKELKGRWSPRNDGGFTFSEMEVRKRKHRLSRLQ